MGPYERAWVSIMHQGFGVGVGIGKESVGERRREEGEGMEGGWKGGRGRKREDRTYGVGGSSPATARAFRREASCISSSKAFRFSMMFRSRMRASKSFCEGNVLLALE